jgi:hypothetical protein
LSQNLTYVQSFLPISFLTLTIIHQTTSHSFTEEVEFASLIAKTTLSHMSAVVALELFKILIIFAFLAHVLSATTTTDSVFNISYKNNKNKTLNILSI